MNEHLLVTAVLGRTAAAIAADDTQSPVGGFDADPETPDTADRPPAGLLVDGLSR